MNVHVKCESPRLCASTREAGKVCECVCMCVCVYGKGFVEVAVSERFLGSSPNTSRRHDTIITLTHTCTHSHTPLNDVNLSKKRIKTFKAAGADVTAQTGADSFKDCSLNEKNIFHG